MTKMTFGSYPHMLGFEQLEQLLERTAKSSEGYPPFNIEQTGEDSYRITLAVAGFSEDDLSITVEDRQLVIRGRQQEDVRERIFLHRGIAARQFQRSFVLADGIEVRNASLDKGLLHIDMERVIPQSSARKIDIKSSDTQGNGKSPKALAAIDIDSTDSDEGNKKSGASKSKK